MRPQDIRIQFVDQGLELRQGFRLRHHPTVRTPNFHGTETKPLLHEPADRGRKVIPAEMHVNAVLRLCFGGILPIGVQQKKRQGRIDAADRRQ